METISQLSWAELLEEQPSTPSSFAALLRSLGVQDTLPGWPDAFGSALRAEIGRLTQPIRTLSLFSGGGGLDIAFHDAGFQISQMVELEPRYVETLALNAQAGGLLEGTEPLCMNIQDFDPPAETAIDFLIGGPPCQTFSAAGRRAAGVAGLDDPRGCPFRITYVSSRNSSPKGFSLKMCMALLGRKVASPGKRLSQPLLMQATPSAIAFWTPPIMACHSTASGSLLWAHAKAHSSFHAPPRP